MTVTITPVCLKDVLPLENISVTKEQDKAGYVAPNIVTIAQARFETGAYDFCIWNGDTRIGMLAMIDMAEHENREAHDDPNAAYVWRLLIGADFQGKGFGKATMAMAEDWARERGKSLIQIQAVETNAPAIKLYESLGYSHTGKKSGDEIQLEKRL